MFEAPTPKNQMRQTGPNFCPYCDYWHPVANMVPDHVEREHAGRVARPHTALNVDERNALRAAAAKKRSEIRARKEERLRES